MAEDKLNDKQRLFLKIYQKNMGVVAKACREANIARTTFYDWRKNEAFAAECKMLDEEVIDFAENALYRKIADGDTTSIIFFLKTKGKHRGYIERTEVAAEVSDSRKKEIEELAIKFFSK